MRRRSRALPAARRAARRMPAVVRPGSRAVPPRRCRRGRLSSRSTAPLAAAAAPATDARMSARPSPEACMFIHAPTAMTIASTSPSHAQIVRSNAEREPVDPADEREDQQQRSERRRDHRRASCRSRGSMLASRSACQTMQAIASRPAIQPDPVPHADADVDARDRLDSRRGRASNQLKNETIRKATVAPSTSLAPGRELLELVHFPPFPFGGVANSLAFERRM